jgi:hypothetical protein
LPTTNIKFLFFLFDGASDTLLPKIKTTFSRLTINGKNNYVSRGVSPNYVYIYSESDLKYVAIISQSPSDIKKSVWTPSHLKIDKRGDISHGDHLTFGLIRNKNKDTIIKTHKRIYVDVAGNFTFEKESNCPECNYVFNRELVSQNLNKYSGNTYCETLTGVILPKTLMSEYGKGSWELVVIHRLCKVLLGGFGVGGSNRNSVGDKYSFRYIDGKRCTVFKGKRGGCYIMKGGKRSYLQIGGGSFYKDISFMTDVFVSFVQEKILMRVVSFRPDLVSVRVIFDEFNELGSEGNKYICFIYEFQEESINVFYIESQIALVACYVDNVIENIGDISGITEYEKICHTEFQDAINSVIVNV